MVKISTSILSKNDAETIKKLDKTDTDYIHIDVMDGKFVPNQAFSIEEIKEVNKYTSKPLDIHLMVNNINDYIKEIKALNISFITFHFEVLNKDNDILKIKELGIKCGISVKPNTNIKDIFPLLDKIDLVLIMSVEPGYGGQEFIPASLQKINLLNEERKKRKLDILIAVDGGINEHNAKQCIKSGADILVVGSYITNSVNFQQKVTLLR